MQMQEKNQRTKHSLGKKFVIVYLISFVILQVVAPIIFIIFPGILEDDILMARMMSILNLSWYLGLTIALVAIGKIYLFDNQWQYFISDKARSLGFVVVGFVAILMVNGVLGVLMEALGHEIDPENQAALEGLIQGGPLAIIPLIIFAGLLAPVVEEIVYRKGIWDLFEKSTGFIGAIIINSFFFGLIHIIADISFESLNIINIVPYFGMGMVISLIYFYSGKIIFVPIFVHMIYNIFALIAMFFFA